MSSFAPAWLGTPLTQTATTVMLLGSGELSRGLAMAFQRLGVEVHAVDRVPYAPALQVAHYAHVIDVADPAAVTTLIREVRPDFIIPEIETIAADVLAAAEEADISTVVPSAKAAGLSTSREALRTLADRELGLPTTSYEFVSDFTGFEVAVGEIGYPCVAKVDVEGPGTPGHRVIRSEEEVAAAWEHLTAHQPDCRVVVERYVNFESEITMLAVRSLDPETGKPATWFCEPIGQRYEQGTYVESWQPAYISERAAENARSVAARVSNALGGRGVFAVKLFVSGEDVYFSEVTARPYDTGLVTCCSQRFSQFELHALAVLGWPIDVTLVSPGAAHGIESPVTASSVTYRHVDRALALPEVSVELFGKYGATPGRRLGVAFATANTVDEARQRAEKAAGLVDIEAAGEAAES